MREVVGGEVPEWVWKWDEVNRGRRGGKGKGAEGDDVGGSGVEDGERQVAVGGGGLLRWEELGGKKRRRRGRGKRRRRRGGKGRRRRWVGLSVWGRVVASGRVGA